MNYVHNGYAKYFLFMMLFACTHDALAAEVHRSVSAFTPVRNMFGDNAHHDASRNATQFLTRDLHLAEQQESLQRQHDGMIDDFRVLMDKKIKEVQGCNDAIHGEIESIRTYLDVVRNIQEKNAKQPHVAEAGPTLKKALEDIQKELQVLRAQQKELQDMRTQKESPGVLGAFSILVAECFKGCLPCFPGYQQKKSQE